VSSISRSVVSSPALANPTPCQVDTLTVDAIFLGNTMMIMLLEHAFHRHDVSALQHYTLHDIFMRLRPDLSQLELSGHTQRQRDNADVNKLTLE